MVNDGVAIKDARPSPVVEIASGKLRGANAAGVCAFKARHPPRWSTRIRGITKPVTSTKP
jgi:hypothetical protein